MLPSGAQDASGTTMTLPCSVPAAAWA
jgi:hypothetical protein